MCLLKARATYHEHLSTVSDCNTPLCSLFKCELFTVFTRSTGSFARNTTLQIPPFRDLFGQASNSKQSLSLAGSRSSSEMAALGEDLLGIVNKLQDLVFNTIGNDSLDLPQIVCLVILCVP